MRLKIVGVPGSGKTTYMLNIVDEHLQKGLSPTGIAFCSFTRAASNEAKNRAIKRFGYDDDMFPYFRTEHSIAFRLLGLNRDQVFTNKWLKKFTGVYPGYKFSNINVTSEERFSDNMLGTVGDYMLFFQSYMRQTMLPFMDAYRVVNKRYEMPLGYNKDTVRLFMKRYTEFKQDNDLWDFNDMLVGVLERGLYPPVRVLFVDEVQDCSKLLFEVIGMWSKHVEDFYIAGDYLQAIYSWSGASPELLYNYEADEEEILRHSFRLTPEVKDFAARVVSRSKYPLPEFSASMRGGIVEKRPYNSIDWHSLPSCFVLARTRWLLTQIKQDLIDKAVPFVCERVSDSPMHTIKGGAYRSLLKIRDIGEVEEWDLCNLMEFTSKPFLKHGTKANVKRLAQGMYNRQDLEALGFTMEFFSHLDRPDDILNRHIDPWERRYLSKVYSRYGLGAKPLITLTTMHGSKGRERSQVILCPDYTRRTWEGYCSDRESEILLNYVAVTRAIDKLTILHPRTFYSYPLPDLTKG